MDKMLENLWLGIGRNLLADKKKSLTTINHKFKLVKAIVSCLKEDII